MIEIQSNFHYFTCKFSLNKSFFQVSHSRFFDEFLPKLSNSREKKLKTFPGFQVFWQPCPIFYFFFKQFFTKFFNKIYKTFKIL